MGKKPATKSVEATKATTKESKEVVKKGPLKKVAAKNHSHASSKARENCRCQIKGCKREYKAKGYCTAHYKKWRKGEYGMARYKTCKEHECRKPMAMNRHGYCEDHYQNYYVKGVEKAKAAPAEKAAAPAKEAASA